jgi:putative ABC transport system permease protein
VNLLRLISWPYARRHVLRTILTASGIVLGVSVFGGMHTANRTVLGAFAQTIDRIAGKTELQVTAGDTGFGEDVLDVVQSAKTVAVAVPVIEAVVASNIAGQGNLRVLAVDMTGDRRLREYDFDSADDLVLEDALIFLAQPDSVILTKEFAERNGLSIGSRLRLGTAVGQTAFTVRGLMKSSGLATAFGGNLAVMDVYAAQKMFGRGRMFDRVDLALKEGATITAGQQELRTLLGPAFEVQPPSMRGQQFEAMLAAYSIMLAASSAFALFIGVFIIYNSFTIAVAERRSEIGILRALGATRAQIGRIFLAEGAAIGIVGSATGLAIGVLLSRSVATSIATLFGDVYGVSQQAGELATDPVVLSLAFAAGIVTSVVAAAIPARAAARVDPVMALQKGRQQLLSAGESRVRVMLAAGLVIVAIASPVFGRTRPVFYAGYVSGIVAVLLLAPLLSLWVARAIRPVLAWMRPVEGALAADSLIQAPRRTSATVTALMLCLAVVVAFSGMARSTYDSIAQWVDTALNPDLFVTSSATPEVQAPRFPSTMASEIAAIPGVERVQMFRNGRIAYGDGQVMVVALEMESVANTSPQEPVAGNRDDMYREAAAGRGVIVSDSLAQLRGLSPGTPVEIPAPYGLIRLPVVGVVVDYSDGQGAILMDRSVFTRYWRDDTVSDFRVYAQTGTSVETLRQRIVERFANERQVFVLTNEELRSYILNVADQWFNLTWVQIAIAVVVAVLGIVNTLTVSITDRRRELGVLRAVGGLRRQILGTVWLEGVAIAGIGLVLGNIVGGINLYYLLDIVRQDVAGLRLAYTYPLVTAATLVPVMLGAAFSAAIWPAELAVRGSLVEALEYE